MKKVLPFFLVLFYFSSVFSQDTLQQRIKGTVSDSVTRAPISFSTIRVLSGGSSNIMKTVLTKEDGSYELMVGRQDLLSLSISALGYITQNIVFRSSDTVGLKNILLKPAASQLATVEVTARVPLVKQEIDRLTYDVQADPESKSINALDMMRKVPLLSVDADDNILLRGNSGYRILINGRASGMMVNNPKDILRSMPASSIQKIEVITTPPVKYDSEGIAGLINIITLRKMSNGYTAGINTGYRTPSGGPAGGLSATVKSGFFGISASGGVNLYNSPETMGGANRTSLGANPEVLKQINSNKLDRTATYSTGEISFDIDTLNLITVEGYTSGGNSDILNKQLSILSTSQSDTLQRYGLTNNGRNDYGNRGFGLNYQLGFRGNRNHLLTFSYKYFKSGDAQLRNLTTTERFNYSDPDYKLRNAGNYKEQTVQLDHILPMKKLVVETGGKVIFRSNSSEFQYDSLNASTNNFEKDPARSNDYENTQYILGLYNSYQFLIGSLTFKAGLRLEYTAIDADFILTASTVKQYYTNLIPALSLNKKFKNGSSLNFGYTRRISRPNIYNLNPFVDRTNPNFQSSGNPELRPVLGNALELNYTRFKKGSVNVGINYSFANNTIQQIFTYDPASQITRSTFSNIGKDKVIGSNLNLNYPLSSNWGLTMFSNLSYIFIKGVVSGQSLSNNGFRGYYRVGSTYKFKNNLRLNSGFNYSSPYVTLQGRTSAYPTLSFSASKGMFEDKLTFSAAVNNPFVKYLDFRTESAGVNFSQNNTNRYFNRIYSFNVNYRFGKLKDQLRKNSRRINNDDSVQ